jgi:Holliday junction resolvasome RuvABC endonuclease subunit
MTSRSRERVFGLDLSLRSTGVADIVHGPSGYETPRLSVIQPKLPRGASLADKVDRLFSISEALEAAGAYAADMVAIEDYAMRQQQTNTTYQLGEVGGMVRHDLRRRNRPFSIVPITVVKKFACGRGDGEKHHVAAGMRECWGPIDFRTDDESDALALGTIAARLLGLPIPGPDRGFRDPLVSELEVIECNRT